MEKAIAQLIRTSPRSIEGEQEKSITFILWVTSMEKYKESIERSVSLGQVNRQWQTHTALGHPLTTAAQKEANGISPNFWLPDAQRQPAICLKTVLPECERLQEKSDFSVDLCLL